MTSRRLALWASAVLLAVFLAPATRPDVAPLGSVLRGNGWGQESALLLITAGLVVVQVLVVLLLSIDYSAPKPSRGDLDHLAGLKRRWAVLPRHIAGCGPRAKPRASRGGRPAAGLWDPDGGPPGTLGQLLAIKRGGAWEPRTGTIAELGR